MTTGRLVNLIETNFADQQPEIDEENGIIKSVKVLGRESENDGGKRVYSDHALWQAVKLYDGIPVNVDHPPRENAAQERSVTHGLGWLSNPRYDSKRDGVVADLHYLKSHPHAAMLVESAKRNPRRFGLSHNADGRVTRDPKTGDHVVDHIEKVRSVDVVQTPATNTGLFESKAPEKPMKITVRDILESPAGKRRNPRFKNLLEEDGVSQYGDDVMSEDEVDGNDIDDSAIDAALCKLAQGIFSGEGDFAAKCAKFQKLCGKYGMSPGAMPESTNAPPRKNHGPDADAAEVIGEGAEVKPGPGVPVDGPTAVKPGPGANGAMAKVGKVAESIDPEEFVLRSPTVRRLLERVERSDKLAEEADCRELLESKNRDVEPYRVRALLGLRNQSDRVALIESWPEKSLSEVARPRVLRPASSSSAILESEDFSMPIPTDGKSMLAALR
jgi:hypothetical protein